MSESILNSRKLLKSSPLPGNHMLVWGTEVGRLTSEYTKEVCRSHAGATSQLPLGSCLVSSPLRMSVSYFTSILSCSHSFEDLDAKIGWFSTLFETSCKRVRNLCPWDCYLAQNYWSQTQNVVTVSFTDHSNIIKTGMTLMITVLAGVVGWIYFDDVSSESIKDFFWEVTKTAFLPLGFMFCKDDTACDLLIQKRLFSNSYLTLQTIMHKWVHKCYQRCLFLPLFSYIFIISLFITDRFGVSMLQKSVSKN